VLAILWGGTSCAILDGTAIMAAFGLKGVKPAQLGPGVASRLSGPESFRRGNPSVAVGILFHCSIAFVAAAVFTEASHSFPFLAIHDWISGACFGWMVFLVMNPDRHSAIGDG
jgi:hypothetical protein